MPIVQKIQPSLNRMTNQAPTRPIRDPGAAGDLIVALGKTGEEISGMILKASALHEKTKAQNTLDGKLIDIRSRAENDNDISGGNMRKYMEEVETASSDASGMITLPALRQSFQNEAEGKLGITRQAIQSGFTRKTIAYGKVELDNYMDNKLNEYIQADNPKDKQSAILERDDKIREALEAGYIMPADAAKMQADLNEEWANQQVVYDISTNPEAARLMLERKVYEGITESERVQHLKDAKAAEKKQKKEIDDQLKEHRETTMRDATVAAMNDEITLDKATQLLKNGDLDVSQFKDLKKMILEPENVDDAENQMTYNRIKQMISQGVDRAAIQNEINKSINKSLRKEDAEELLDEAFREEADTAANIKRNAMEKIQAFSKREILKDAPFEIAPAVLVGKAQELEYQFNKKVIEEKASGQRIYEIADEVIDGYMQSVDPNYKPEKKDRSTIKVLPEGAQAFNPTTGEVKKVIGGRWVTILQPQGQEGQKPTQ